MIKKFWYEDSETGKVETVTMPILQFIGLFISHRPEKRFKMLDITAYMQGIKELCVDSGKVLAFGKANGREEIRIAFQVCLAKKRRRNVPKKHWQNS